MTSDEILKLHQEIDEHVKKRIAEKYDASVIDNQLAALVSMPGWEILEYAVNSMIAELLEEPEFSDAASCELRCAVHTGRQLAIDSIRNFLKIATATYASKKVESEEKN